MSALQHDVPAVPLRFISCLVLFVSCSCHRNPVELNAWTGNSTDNTQDAEMDFPLYRQWPFDDDEAKRRQEETAARLGVSVRERLTLTNGVHLDLVLIPTGRFVMGFKKCASNKPHEVAIEKPFYIGALEITCRQYVAFRQRKSAGANCANLFVDSILKHAPHRLDDPILFMTWTACNGYCKSASKSLGCTIRLPYEAEWEYAARAGTTGRFIWDDTLICDGASFSPIRDNVRSVQKGTLSRANPWGVYDVIGSVEEWVIDMYTNNECVRALRGGGPLVGEGIAERKPQLITAPDPYDGFRVVVEIDKKLLVLLQEKQKSTPHTLRVKDRTKRKMARISGSDLFFLF